MKRFLLCFIFLAIIFSGFAQASDKEVPPEVPPCPEEYQDGLKP
ncbi:hypothetical protein QUF76_17430 [Desulfobacterales bacterium HSG16]|nr:hypothetical protein [Desulfobacterales bacterium HSG16]